MNRLRLSPLLSVVSLLLLCGYPVIEWWALGWPAVLVGLYHTATAVSVGYIFSLSRSVRREEREAKERTIAVHDADSKVRLLRLKGTPDEFAEGMFYAGIRIGAEEAATRVEELGAVAAADQLRREVRAALPETEGRLQSWQAMRERETGGAQ